MIRETRLTFAEIKEIVENCNPEKIFSLVDVEIDTLYINKSKIKKILIFDSDIEDISARNIENIKNFSLIKKGD